MFGKNHNLLISFYVPEDYLDEVKNALFNAGAGKLGNYDRCSWETKGFGQFRPLPGSSPHLGKTNLLTVTAEYKVEMICEKKYLKQAITALKSAHPYETPAYSVIKLENL
jgi:hypothetical protein